MHQGVGALPHRRMHELGIVTQRRRGVGERAPVEAAYLRYNRYSAQQKSPTNNKKSPKARARPLKRHTCVAGLGWGCRIFFFDFIGINYGLWLRGWGLGVGVRGWGLGVGGLEG